MRHCLTCLFVLCVPVGLIRADDWPAWRGPTGQGVSAAKGLPTTWSKEGTNLLWKAPLPGLVGKNRQDQNQSSPIIVKGRVIVISSFWPEAVDAAKSQPEHHVVCYALHDGKLLWDVTVKPGPWQFADLRGGYTATTPASDGERIFVFFGSSVLAALNLDGKQLWRNDVIPFDFDVAIGSSPVVVGGYVILQCDGVKNSSRLAAYDCKTGEQRWEKKRPKNNFSHSTPTPVRVGDKSLLLVAASQELQGVDPTDGSVVWSCAGRGDTVSPVLGNGIAYVDSGRGGMGIAVDPTGAGDVSKTHLKWSVKQVPEGFSSPLIFGDYLYRLHNPNMLSCRKLADGESVYAERLQDVSTTASPFVSGDGLIYLASSGRSYVVKPGPQLEVVATNDLGDPSPASAAVADGRIVFKGKKAIYCVGK